MMRFFVTLICLSLSQMSVASGWDCYGKSYHAKIRHSTRAPRKVARFVLSHKEEGTLLSTGASDIQQESIEEGVSYKSFGPGEQLLATLTVNYHEGSDEPLENGAKVEGNLVLESIGADAVRIFMSCFRYLKQ